MTEPNRPRLLIADDELPQMKALAETLRDHGYETVGVSSGEAALAQLRNAKFDLLLTDLSMPGMDGIALLRAALATDPHLVGIIMTGHGTITSAVEAMKEGALDYILKPFKVSVVLPVLSRALAMRQLRLENAALQRRVRERTAELEVANAELDLFAGSVAHDLHTPARHIAGFARLLIEDHQAELSPTLQRHLSTIAQAGERMGNLISDLLAFSRLGRVKLRLERVDTSALVARVWNELKNQRELLEPDWKNRALVWKLGELPVVHADESMLRQVFYNLLSNALKYSRSRNPAEIEVGCQSSTDGVTLYVRDNGIGFDMSQADKLFGMFQRLHAASEFEGNGIGLANVRRIIQRHGGRVWAESAVEHGATFYFALPHHAAPASARDPLGESHAPARSAGSAPN
jgi:signal transduction histidine kinase